MSELGTLSPNLMGSRKSCKYYIQGEKIYSDPLSNFRSLLLHACWSYTPAKRPLAGEIVELLYNNPRLLSPCVGVPLASVHIEGMDETLRQTIRNAPKKSSVKQSDRTIAGLDHVDMNIPITNATPADKECLTTNAPVVLNDEEHSEISESSLFLSKDPLSDIHADPDYVMLDHSDKNSEYCNFSQ